MNLYLCIRSLLHALLFVANLLALTAAAWSIHFSRSHSGIGVSPGAVLILLGWIAYSFFEVILWVKKWSRVRTDVIGTPVLLGFQSIGAIVATATLSQSVCHEQNSCMALIILSWMSVVIGIVNYLIFIAVVFHHVNHDPDVWDASILKYPWFSHDQSGPPPPPKFELGAPQFQLGAAPSEASHASTQSNEQREFRTHARKRSSWMGPLPASPNSSMPTLPEEAHTSQASVKSRQSRTPMWAKKINLRRALELPFPVQSPPSTKRNFEEPPRIDAPATRESFEPFIFDRDSIRIYDGYRH